MDLQTEQNTMQVRGQIPRSHPVIENQPDILPRAAFKRIVDLAADSEKMRQRAVLFLTEDHPLKAATHHMSVNELLVYLIGYTRKDQSTPNTDRLNAVGPTVVIGTNVLATPVQTSTANPAPEAVSLDDDDLDVFAEVPLVYS